MIDFPLTVAFTLAVFALVMAIVCIPLAVIEVRVTRRAKAVQRDRAAIERLSTAPIEVVALASARRSLASFLTSNVLVTKFGDRRRRDGHISEFTKLDHGSLAEELQELAARQHQKHRSLTREQPRLDSSTWPLQHQ